MTMLSAFDLYSIGIGPSSSHTVGPMRAGRRFADGLRRDGLLDRTSRVRVELYGSLGATGHGHGSPGAVILGLEGETPAGVDVDAYPGRVTAVRRGAPLLLAGERRIAFDIDADLVMHRRSSLPRHPNGMVFEAYDAGGELLRSRRYYSVGGGFILDDDSVQRDGQTGDEIASGARHFHTGADLLRVCEESGSSISEVMMSHELTLRPAEEVRGGLLEIWHAMESCVERGCTTNGVLPGGLKVRRRAPGLHAALVNRTGGDPLDVMDWVNLFALAVNEENAAGGRVVTAPTNGAAGIVPAVLHYWARFVARPEEVEDGVVRFMLTAAAIGVIIKENASISGAEVGCQGEVGSACAMAAAGLCELLGGSPAQVENAAEIGIEHNLGLTCDPIGGLVQIPCIERNAVAAVKAINGARLATHGDGAHHVSFDRVLRVMRQTGADMHVKYKETSRGGLAVNIIEC